MTRDSRCALYIIYILCVYSRAHILKGTGGLIGTPGNFGNLARRARGRARVRGRACRARRARCTRTYTYVDIAIDI